MRLANTVTIAQPFQLEATFRLASTNDTQTNVNTLTLTSTNDGATRIRVAYAKAVKVICILLLSRRTFGVLKARECANPDNVSASLVECSSGHRSFDMFIKLAGNC